jgi:hypothetical protein
MAEGKVPSSTKLKAQNVPAAPWSLARARWFESPEELFDSTFFITDSTNVSTHPETSNWSRSVGFIIKLATTKQV